MAKVVPDPIHWLRDEARIPHGGSTLGLGEDFVYRPFAEIDLADNLDANNPRRY
jgi:hypothetical protein